jgi:UDPglucose 6-dehydrogenase
VKVCVYGLWHLGCVTAACLAERGHQVTGLDPADEVVARLQAGKAPLFEPGLDELIQKNLAAGRLRFTRDAAEAVQDGAVVWVTFDTPVNEQDEADTAFVQRKVVELFPLLPAGALVLLSSQMPVGSVRSLEAQAQADVPGRGLRFACSPENLRLGQAIKVFTEPDRIIAGCRTAADRELLRELFAPITDKVEWMGVESAEMTKHAINSFLALSVCFINEIATLCERYGADAGEVARGLKTEARIGPKAYLSPGGAFAGGTLARDVAFLSHMGESAGVGVPLIRAIRTSNDAHRAWALQRLHELWGGALAGQCVAVWGLTYKPGTDTLRRSSSVELCRQLLAAGAVIQAFDPAIAVLPADLAASICLCTSAAAALDGAQALVMATPWPAFRQVPATVIARALRGGLVLDADRFLAQQLAGETGLKYVTVGRPVT